MTPGDRPSKDADASPASDLVGLRRDAPATHRNREPIFEVLARWLPGSARVLEVASGTGQHAVYLAGRMPGLAWQPTEVDPDSLPSIEAWIADAGRQNVLPPRLLDASDVDWPEDVGRVDAIFTANLLHISPWSVGLGLVSGAGRALRDGGLLLIYGPFKMEGAHTAPSNAAFDESLRARDPSWGVRDLEAVVEAAAAAGLAHRETNALPANNLLVVFERVGAGR